MPISRDSCPTRRVGPAPCRLCLCSASRLGLFQLGLVFTNPPKNRSHEWLPSLPPPPFDTQTPTPNWVGARRAQPTAAVGAAQTWRLRSLRTTEPPTENCWWVMFLSNGCNRLHVLRPSVSASGSDTLTVTAASQTPTPQAELLPVSAVSHPNVLCVLSHFYVQVRGCSLFVYVHNCACICPPDLIVLASVLLFLVATVSSRASLGPCHLQPGAPPATHPNCFRPAHRNMVAHATTTA